MRRDICFYYVLYYFFVNPEGFCPADIRLSLRYASFIKRQMEIIKGEP